MPKESRFPTMPPKEFPANQTATRRGASSLVYHIVVIYRKAGLLDASRAPVRNLVTRR